MQELLEKMVKSTTIIDNSDILSGPLQISLDVTNRCNLKCLHCFNRSAKDELIKCDLIDQELLDEQFINIVNQIASIHPFSICFCGGEPMLRYNIIVEACTILKRANVPNVSMVSNGTLLTEEKIDNLKHTGMTLIQISLDGYTRESHDKLRGVKGTYEKALNAIHLLVNSGLSSSVAFSPTKFNIHEFPKYVTLFPYKRNFDIRVQPLMPLGNTFKNKDILPTTKEYRNLIKFIKKHNYLHQEPYIEWGDPIDHLIRNTYISLSQTMYASIKSDGSLEVSPYLPIRIGNLKRHTLNEYWNAGLGKMWMIPIVKEIASTIQTIDDMSTYKQEVPKIYYEKCFEFDLIDDHVFNNLNKFTLHNLRQKGMHCYD